jgi:hypothetical protein
MVFNHFEEDYTPNTFGLATEQYNEYNLMEEDD